MRFRVRILVVAFLLAVLVCLGALPFVASADAYDAQPSAEALEAAVAALRRHRAEVRNKQRWTLIDYDRPFTAVRLWVLDAEHANAVVVASRVSHAWRSGVLRATSFSNQYGSQLSSPGSYVTAPRPYDGRFGHSLRIRGLDRGVNDNAWKRAIIFHPDLGMTHSAGCFMLPESEARRVVDAISGGTFVYVYAPQP